MNINLRFVIRDGNKVLQYETEEYYGRPYYDVYRRLKHDKRSVWKDVPVYDEQTGDKLQDEKELPKI
jgi:hypothetical protein